MMRLEYILPLFVILLHSVNAQDSLCTLCAGGEEPTVLDEIYIGNEGDHITCSFLQEFLSTFTQRDVDSGRCKGWQEIGAIHCGCTSRPEDVNCHLCFDGSLPLDPEGSPLPIQETTNQEVSCRTILINAAQETDPDICENYQLKGLANCECPIPEEYTENCPICVTGGTELLPDPDLEILPSITCNGASRITTVQGDETCGAFQNVAGYYCGCPEMEVGTLSEGVCRICGDGVPLPDFGREFLDANGDIASCGELELEANMDDLENCGDYQDSADVAGCCDAVPRASIYDAMSMPLQGVGGLRQWVSSDKTLY